MFRVSFETHIFDDLGLGDLCFTGFGECDADFDLRDFRYRPRELERDELLSEDDAPRLRLLLFSRLGAFTAC